MIGDALGAIVEILKSPGDKGSLGADVMVKAARRYRRRTWGLRCNKAGLGLHRLHIAVQRPAVAQLANRECLRHERLGTHQGTPT
jgi:hypothetical protein